jgi:hypothetical protein
MTTDQLRTALRELNGERDLEVIFAGPQQMNAMHVRNAMLIPDEQDHLVKVTDGRSVFILDADRVAWIRIGLK